MQTIPGWIRTIIGTLLNTLEKPTMQRTVKEYLWGYSDPILSNLKKLLPQLVPNDQISVFASAVIFIQIFNFVIFNKTFFIG